MRTTPIVTSPMPVSRSTRRWGSIFFAGLLVGTALCGAPALANQIYVYQMPGGGRMITDQVRHDSGFRLLKTYRDRSLPSPRGATAHPRPMASGYDPMIEALADSLRMDTALIKAVVHAESAFNPYAVSDKGAQGLMQLMPATADRYGVVSALDPRENLRGGISYLKDLLAQFGGDTRLALAGYNAGENAVERFGGIPPFPETRHYVEKVLSLHKAYRAMICTDLESACGRPPHRRGVWRALGLNQ